MTAKPALKLIEVPVDAVALVKDFAAAHGFKQREAVRRLILDGYAKNNKTKN